MGPKIDKYQRLRDLGWTPVQVCRAMIDEGIGMATTMGLLRRLFPLSLRESKEITLVADGSAKSLDEYQGRLLPDLKQILA